MNKFNCTLQGVAQKPKENTMSSEDDYTPEQVKKANDLKADARALLVELDREVRPLPQWEKDILASLERGFE